MLDLELTESILIRDTENVLATVKRLKLMGVKLSIDDFALAIPATYLKRFEVDKLKIDQAFVRDLATDSEDAAIVRAVIQMAHSLGLKTIAEGVEAKEVLDLLRLHRCDEARKAISTPVPCLPTSSWPSCPAWISAEPGAVRPSYGYNGNLWWRAGRCPFSAWR